MPIWFNLNSTFLKPQSASPLKHIVFFDGICTLCNNFVDTLIKIDKNNVLQYASLQGNTAAEYLKNTNTAALKTVVYYSDGQLFIKSDAVLEILASIGGIWKLAIVLKIIPKQIRDYVYDVIAKNRLKWFGQKQTCRMPTTMDKGKILG